jgi:hypothetical protein
MAFKNAISPYALFFTTDESENRVRVLSCFHTEQDPKKNLSFKLS